MEFEQQEEKLNKLKIESAKPISYRSPRAIHVPEEKRTIESTITSNQKIATDMKKKLQSMQTLFSENKQISDRCEKRKQ